MIHSNERIIKHKVGLLNLAEELGNVSKACQMMGLSRDTFYRYKAAVEEGGVEGLLEKDRRRANLKNRTDERTEGAVVEYAIEQPAHGQIRTSNELRKRGFFLSPSGVRSVWLRHDLATFRDRLRAFVAIGFDSVPTVDLAGQVSQVCRAWHFLIENAAHFKWWYSPFTPSLSDGRGHCIYIEIPDPDFRPMVLPFPMLLSVVTEMQKRID